MRKTIKIAPGIRMTVTPRGVGYSVGTKGARVTKHVNGRVSTTVSLPGTGLSHTSSGRARATSARPGRGRPTVTPPTPVRSPRPGVFAPAWEKALFAALQGSEARSFGAVARAHGAKEPQVRHLAAALEGLAEFTALDRGSGDAARARSLLGWVAAEAARVPAAHPFTATYLAGTTWPVEVAGGVTADLRLEDDVVLLAVAELHQAAGDLAAAIWTVEQADPTTIAALSLADLYTEAERHQEVVDLTTGITNDDDATALLIAFRGRAFSKLGYHEAAREALKDALRVKSRGAGVRHRALLERADVHVRENRRASARKDLERILVEDPQYPGLAAALAHFD